MGRKKKNQCIEGKSCGKVYTTNYGELASESVHYFKDYEIKVTVTPRRKTLLSHAYSWLKGVFKR